MVGADGAAGEADREKTRHSKVPKRSCWQIGVCHVYVYTKIAERASQNDRPIAEGVVNPRDSEGEIELPKN